MNNKHAVSIRSARRILRLFAAGLLLIVSTSTVASAQKKAELGKKAAGQQTTVKLKVRLPQDFNVTLRVNGKEITSENGKSGATRVVDASPITDDKDGATDSYCDLQVTWEPNNYTTITRQRRVKVQSGRTYDVDLSEREKTDKPDDIVVIYVPTPDHVVDKLLDLAKVTKNDVVFDLGCGDGRMVCRAIANRGAKRGVGVDIDPDRIRDSRKTAKEYKVADKVEWREGDVLKSIDDLPEASVVMLYMGDDIGARLAPILQQKLKPGSRVVSHRFHLGDWKPDKTITVDDPTRTNELDHVDLHLWVVK